MLIKVVFRSYIYRKLKVLHKTYWRRYLKMSVRDILNLQADGCFPLNIHRLLWLSLFFLTGHQSDFNKNHEGNVFNITYDYYSIMHYKTNQFSKDPENLRTIQILDPHVIESEVGQRKYLSNKDKQRIKLLYNCREYNIGYFFFS